VYAYPLRPPALAWLGIMTGAAALFDIVGSFNGILALLLGLAWWTTAFKLASEALARAAAGRDDDAGFEVFAGDAAAFRQLLLGLGVIAVGTLLGLFAPPSAYIAYCLALALLLPAMLIALVMEDGLLGAFDPRMWFELLRRLGGAYLGLALQFALLTVGVVLAIRALGASGLPSFLAEALAHGLSLYLLLVAYHALGALLDEHRDALEMAPVAPAPLASAGVAREERAALPEVDRLLAEGRKKEAAAVLDRLIRGRGATAPVHARSRALLAELGDEAGLVAHARGHVATLLHLRQEREALALYLDAKRRDPGFELGDPQPVSDLIAIAARNQQSQLAVSLYEEFARRFPNDRDLVTHGLAAAKLMDRLDRDQQARTVLRELIRRFPEHPLRAELDAALAAVGR
jgi:tetratricopeptide (TPR) repeat protein